MRKRFGLYLIVTIVFLAGVALLYGQRSGRLAIFADVPVVPGSLELTDPIDLAKGLQPDSGLTANATGIHFEEGSPRTIASAQFDIGNPQITTIYRVRPLGVVSAPGEAVSLQVAGSLDGVSWGELSAPLTLDTGPESAVAVTDILPPGSHFIRIVLTFVRTEITSTPSLGGLALDYDLLAGQSTGRLDVSADPVSPNAQVTVNATVAGSTEAPARTRDTAALAATGVDVPLFFLAALWIVAMVCLAVSAHRSDTQ